MTGPDTPFKRLYYYGIGSIVATVMVTVVMGLLTSPIMFALLTDDATMAGLGFLSLLSWGIYLGQEVVLGESHEEPEMGLIGKSMLMLLSIVYYNLVLAVAVVISSAVIIAGFPVLGAIIALVYPAYDMGIIEKGLPLSIAGVLGLILGLVMTTKSVAENVDLSDIRPESFILDLFKVKNPYRPH